MSEENYEEDIKRQFTRTAYEELYKICYKTLVKSNGSSIDFQKQIDCHSRLLQVFKTISPFVMKFEQAVASGDSQGSDEGAGEEDE